MKLWQKSTDALDEVNKFTAGQDSMMDRYLIRYDLIGSIAHVLMLGKVGLLNEGETDKLVDELRKLHQEAVEGNFKMDDGVEDIHSQVELELTKRLGEIGKKVHSGRSRNDQVLTDIKLFLRSELAKLAGEVRETFDLLLELSEKHKDKLLPGYTHLQLAMPSSFGLWFGAYAEALTDDLIQLQAAYRLSNRNPLGSAAGYGSSFPIDRNYTTNLLGFEGVHINVVNAQMSRGKSEKSAAHSIAAVAATLSRLSMDACLYLNPNFGFISFPEELTTGSSIMPHKKNPDVFELIRARCNQLQVVPVTVNSVMTNLPSGYHRDFQVLKEVIFPSFETISDCLRMTRLMLSNISVRANILDEEKYAFLFSVEEVNKLVLQGIPFRDAYRIIGQKIESGEFQTDRKIVHTHLGSIGNPGTDKIRKYFQAEYEKFRFSDAQEAIDQLLKQTSY